MRTTMKVSISELIGKCENMLEEDFETTEVGIVEDEIGVHTMVLKAVGIPQEGDKDYGVLEEVSEEL